MSIDRDDAKTGWTIQQGALAEVDPEINDPGMVYHRSQLPDPEVAKEAGFKPQPEPEAVFDDAEEAVAHPNGPNADELHWADLKDAVANAVKDVESAVKSDPKDEDVDVSSEAPEDKPAE